jgi:uncharacterized coiled-coil DUF342 family protein
MNLRSLKSIKNKIETSKAKIAKESDKLREIHMELTTLVEHFDDAEYDLDGCARELCEIIDKLSEEV